MPFTLKPVQQGTHLKTQMIRVDADFAAAVKREALANDVKATDVTRQLYESLYAEQWEKVIRLAEKK